MSGSEKSFQSSHATFSLQVGGKRILKIKLVQNLSPSTRERQDKTRSPDTWLNVLTINKNTTTYYIQISKNIYITYSIHYRHAISYIQIYIYI